MTTAEALEGMTDPGQFEVLATRTLREISTDCSAIVHSGVNAQYKTIANPLDGFCLVPASSPPRYVMAEFTTTGREGLVTKWLFDHTTYKPTGRRRSSPPTQADDGDLIKAGRTADGIRARDADAAFIVWLCTNQRLDNELQHPVYDKARELGIEVRFLEQSSLRDFLDTKPEGQWLRQEHLGIEADQMSTPLLRQLSQKSVKQYASDALLPALGEIVPTRAAELAGDAILGPEAVHLLVGSSGVGKSVIGQDVLRRHLHRGGSGLWIPAEVAEREAFLSDAIGAVLKSLHPRSCVGAGHEALRLASMAQPLVVIVDDINRSRDPVILLRKVVGWSRPGERSDGAKGDASSPVRLVCPVWEAYWEPLRRNYESMSWVRVQGIGPMSRPESIACLNAASGEHAGAFTKSQLGDFAQLLHDDPILLGLFGELLQADPSANPYALCENVIGNMIARSVGERAVANGIPRGRYTTALNRLSTEMIRKRVLYPSWEQTDEWFEAEPDVRARLDELAAQAHVCRSKEADGLHRLEFRHDRILEYQLAQAASVMVRTEGADRDAVTDPFFIPFVGRAVARGDLPGTVLEWVNARNPAALVAAVPFLPISQSDYGDKVVQLARAWLGQHREIPDSMCEDAITTLAQTRSPRVLEVTDGLPPNRLLCAARLRNGNARAGVFVLSEKFYPAKRFPWLESLIEEAQTHYRPQLTDELRTLLQSSSITDQERKGALCLAGYLGDAGLAPDVTMAWENARDQREVLLAALWAGLRCAEHAPGDLLDAMMHFVLTLQHDESGKIVTQRYSLLQELRFASRHGFSEPVLTYLAEFGTANEAFRWIVVSVLEDVDHPVAIEYMVRVLAQANHDAKRAGAFSSRAQTWGDRWSREGIRYEGRLSAASIAELRSRWTDKRSPEWLQRYAFSRWARCVDDLNELAEVKPDSPHYAFAVWRRAELGDRAIAGYVLAKVNEESHWYHLVANVWGDEFEPALDAALGEIASNPNARTESGSNLQYWLGELLRDIPTATAERLLVKHWKGLGELPRFVQAALYHGSAKCQELAAQSLAQTEERVDPFEHIGSFFGFFSQGLMDRLKQKHLETLRPYLQRVDDLCLSDMVEYCRSFGNWSWAEQHLQPEMRRRVSLTKHESDKDPPYLVRMIRHWFPTDDEILEELDRIEQGGRRYCAGGLSLWWDTFLRRGDTQDRPVQLLLTWLGQDRSPSRFIAVAGLLAERGNRLDLQALLKLRPDEQGPEVEQAAANAEFAVKRRSLQSMGV